MIFLLETVKEILTNDHLKTDVPNSSVKDYIDGAFTETTTEEYPPGKGVAIHLNKNNLCAY